MISDVTKAVVAMQYRDILESITTPQQLSNGSWESQKAASMRCFNDEFWQAYDSRTGPLWDVMSKDPIISQIWSHQNVEPFRVEGADQYGALSEVIHNYRFTHDGWKDTVETAWFSAWAVKLLKYFESVYDGTP